MGAGIGYAFGTLWGAEDDDLNKWVAGGATLGALQKGVQASKVLQVCEKQKQQQIIIKNEAVKLTLQKIRELTSTTTATKLSAFGGKTEKLSKFYYKTLIHLFKKFCYQKLQMTFKGIIQQELFQITKDFTTKE